MLDLRRVPLPFRISKNVFPCTAHGSGSHCICFMHHPTCILVCIEMEHITMKFIKIKMDSKLFVGTSISHIHITYMNFTCDWERCVFSAVLFYFYFWLLLLLHRWTRNWNAINAFATLFSVFGKNETETSAGVTRVLFYGERSRSFELQLVQFMGVSG